MLGMQHAWVGVNAHGFLFGQLERKRPLGRNHVSKGSKIKWILRKHVAVVKNGLICLRKVINGGPSLTLTRVLWFHRKLVKC
jgi:hypothetical protein